ncbi:MAG: YihY/virulence factor BrkB family protein [Actinomycetota bacterium]|nr:YihY/virulence factor BrkB family protein [Actinomycetota bacterium]
MPSPSTLFAGARRRLPLLDHVVRAVSRYQADAGDQLAAAVTYYWFLSLFPVLLLAVWLLGLVYGDQAGAQVEAALVGILPREVSSTLGENLQQAAGPAGALGLAGLLYSGLGWIDALREAIRTLWHQNVQAGNIVVRKLLDVVVLAGLLATVGTSIAVTGTTTAATATVLDLLGVEDTLPARALTRAVAVGAALAADVLLFLYLFARLARVRTPVRRLLRGAVFGAVGFEVLKVLGGLYVARTTSQGVATYGTFAVVVGILVFLNLMSRFLLLSAAFVVTAPYDSDVPPSGTASVELARRAGIPPEFAGGDPDDPPAVRERGAPSPLHAALRTPEPRNEEPGPLRRLLRRG